MHLLRWLNAGAAAVHAAQFAAMVVLVAQSPGSSVPGTYMRASGRPGSANYTLVEFSRMDPRIWSLVFLGVCFLAHSMIATVLWESYQRTIRLHIGEYRWYEYSVSASVMIVNIYQVMGVTDWIAQLNAFACTAFMIWCGFLHERENCFVDVRGGAERGDEDEIRKLRELDETSSDYSRALKNVINHVKYVDWTVFVLGSVVGAVPWVGILFNFFVSDGKPPIVYFLIWGVLFQFFCFAGVAWWVSGRPDRYETGEYLYVLLSLTAKTSLAWSQFSAVGG